MTPARPAQVEPGWKLGLWQLQVRMPDGQARNYCDKDSLLPPLSTAVQMTSMLLGRN